VTMQRIADLTCGAPIGFALSKWQDASSRLQKMASTTLFAELRRHYHGRDGSRLLSGANPATSLAPNASSIRLPALNSSRFL
jgi:hypothetical protein